MIIILNIFRFNSEKSVDLNFDKKSRNRKKFNSIISNPGTKPTKSTKSYNINNRAQSQSQGDLLNF